MNWWLTPADGQSTNSWIWPSQGLPGLPGTRGMNTSTSSFDLTVGEMEANSLLLNLFDLISRKPLSTTLSAVAPSVLPPDVSFRFTGANAPLQSATLPKPKRICGGAVTAGGGVAHPVPKLV